MSDYGGIIGLIILALDIWAIINVIQSGASTGSKVLSGHFDFGAAFGRPDHLVLCRPTR